MSIIDSRAEGQFVFKTSGAHRPISGGSLYFIGSRCIDAPKTNSERAASSTWRSSKSWSPVPEDDIAHKELLERRDRLSRAGRDNPIVRLSAFLVALIHISRDQDSSKLVISERTDCRFVADLLGLGVDDLARHLRRLQSEGLVTHMPNGCLRVTNLDALEQLANGHSLNGDAQTSDTYSYLRATGEPPRIYSRSRGDSVSLCQADKAISFEVISLTFAACFFIAFAVALSAVGP